jgi:putative transposase
MGKCRETFGPNVAQNETADLNIADFDRLPERKKEKALRWLVILNAYRVFARRCPKKKAYKVRKEFLQWYRVHHPDEEHFSSESLRVKLEAFQKQGAIGLIDRRGGARNVAEWPDDAKGYLSGLYLNINQPPLSWCIKHLRMKAKDAGWKLPKSDSPFYHFIDSMPQETRDFSRKGERYWREHYVPSVLRDYESFSPGEIYVADHQQINVAVRHPSGKVIFPWLSGWIDMRSRKVVGWHLDIIPSGDTVNISLKRSIESCGVPEHVVLDNGRDYSSIQFTGRVKKRFRFKINETEFTGIYRLLNIEPHFCIPGNPQSKSIERWFWTQEMHFQKAFSTYRGNNVVNRPEGADARIKDLKHVIDWDDFNVCLDDYIHDYNQSHRHRGHGMDGQPPNEVWDDYFASNPQRRVSPASLRLLMMKSRKVKVGRFGVNAFGNYYRSERLMDFGGEGVVYRYDPGDLSEIHIYDLDSGFLCTAQRVHRTAWNDESAYKEIKSLEKRRRKAVKEQVAVSNELDDIQFGYRPKSKPDKKEQTEEPVKVVRIVRTPLDGVEDQIRNESQKSVAVAGNEGGRNRFSALFSGQRMSKPKEDHRIQFMNLSLGRSVPDEEEY